MRTFLTLLLGLSTAVAQVGLGVAFLRAIRVPLPRDWKLPVGFLLGIQITALGVECLAFAHAATSAFAAFWFFETIFGLACLARDSSRTDFALGTIVPKHVKAVLVVAATALAINLLIALAPSTKIDEIYYHMLLPQRIAAGGGFRFYSEPWEAAILPQMTYQISATPLYALGMGDAMNVVSWTLSALLVYFPIRLLVADDRLNARSALVIAGIVVGMYSAVQYVTGGSHAQADLAIVMCTIAAGRASRMRNTSGANSFAVVISVCGLAAASAKASALPLAGGLVIWGLYRGLLDCSPRHRIEAIVLAALPWLLFYLPIVVWTYSQSGAPFGPLYSWHFPHSIYDPTATKNFFETVRIANHLGLRGFLSAAIVQFSPLVWVAAVAALFGARTDLRDRIAMAVLFVAQCLLVALKLPTQVRFLSGIQFGLALLLLVEGSRTRVLPLSRRLLTAIVVAFLAPWLFVQAYYARPFAAVTLGLTSRKAFLEHYVALYDDFSRLDKILPRNATLLIRNFRAGAYYSPRAAVQDVADLPANSNSYSLGPSCVPHATFSVHGRTEDITLGSPILVDSEAVVETYRTPGKRPIRGLICVQPIIGH